MNEQTIAQVMTIAAAIVGVSVLAVLVSKNAQTPQLIQAATAGFAQDLQAAVSPVTGGFSSFTGGGVQPLNFQ